MRYLMKQHFFSLGGAFTIKDENQQDRFSVSGKLFSIGKKFTFSDMAGNELARIEQKLFSIRKTFFVYRKNELAATVSKNLFSFFRAGFHIDVAGSDPIEVTGSFTDHEYSFSRGGEQIAGVSKKYFSWTDTYGIDIADGADDVLILAAVVIIDTCCHEKK